VIKIKKIIYLVLILIACANKTTGEISDGLFMTIGNKPITKSDVRNEIKLLLILKNESYNEENSKKIYDEAVKSLVKSNIKKIEIEKNETLQINKEDLDKELNRLANNINIDVNTLKNIFSSNDLDFSLVEEQIKVELLWNSLIFSIYRNRVRIDPEKINEKIIEIENNRKQINEYLVSEIIIQNKDENNIELEINELKEIIEAEGFANAAKRISISKSAANGGKLDWVQEDKITAQIKNIVENTPVGQLSEAIVLKDGILIFKIEDKRKSERKINIDKLKDELVFLEKNKILGMHSLSHYDKVKRSVAVNFYK
jgi:peptidyl-prolyl cis-trans isomerase SurA